MFGTEELCISLLNSVQKAYFYSYTEIIYITDTYNKVFLLCNSIITMFACVF